MPRCGSLPVPPGSVERVLPDGHTCIIVPSWTPLATQPLYQQGGFVSANPAATATKQYTDASGATYQDVHTASGGYLGTQCLSNCGAGSGFFGLGGTAADVARLVGNLAGQLAMAASPFAPFYAAGTALAEQTERSQKGMSLNLGGLLGAAGGILGGINTSGFGNISQILGGGLQLAGAALTPQPVAQPQYGIQPYSQPIYALPSQPVAARAPQIVGPAMSAAGVLSVGSAAIAAAKMILPKVAAALGRRGISLSKAVDMARKLGKFFTSPEAIALYMGITVSELAQLITANASRKRRRMNPANAHALRRAARRIKSFHRMCSHTDLIKTRRRSAGRCGTCRKSPCRC